jgi:uncharacterized protein YicC (UPF0701 family)
MTQEHKEALSEGRRQGRIVRDYLEGLEATRPKRGRKRTKDTVSKRISSIESELENAQPLRKLEMIQERLDLLDELETFDETVDMAALEKQFISVAKSYAARRGISYAAFREMGIAAPVLKKAGIGRARK